MTFPIFRFFMPASAGLCILFAAGCVASATAAADEILRVGGTGSSAPLIARLFDEFRRQAPNARLEQVTPPLGSGGAMKALAASRIDLALIGRPPTAEEAGAVGRSVPLATTALVLASLGGSRPAGFSLDELAAVYDGRLRTWDDGKPIRLVLRASFESDTLLLKTMSPRMNSAVEAAGQRPGMAMGQDDLETVELLRKAPGSLGPTTLGLLRTMDQSLTPLPLDGVAPTLDNLRSGRYPWRKTLTLVLPMRDNPLARQFADFLVGEQAATVLRRYDYLPADR